MSDSDRHSNSSEADHENYDTTQIEDESDFSTATLTHAPKNTSESVTAVPALSKSDETEPRDLVGLQARRILTTDGATLLIPYLSKIRSLKQETSNANEETVRRMHAVKEKAARLLAKFGNTTAAEELMDVQNQCPNRKAKEQDSNVD